MEKTMIDLLLLLATCALVTLLAVIIRQIKKMPNVGEIMLMAAEQDRIYAISPINLLIGDCWGEAMQNSWGIFAEKPVGDRKTIVMFDCNGNAVAELCAPQPFFSFEVTDEELILHYHREVKKYPLQSITDYYGMDFALPTAPAACNFNIKSTKWSLYATIHGKRRRLYCRSKLHRWLAVALFVLLAAAIISRPFLYRLIGWR